MPANLESLRQGFYYVPQRFSIAAVLVFMTLFGIIFGALRFADAPAVVYLFLGTQAMVVCMAQMMFGSLPRGASALSGAIFLPAWMLVLAVIGGLPPQQLLAMIFGTPCSMLLGALLGYCIGAVAAGIFLCLDIVERRFAKPVADRPVSSSPFDS